MSSGAGAETAASLGDLVRQALALDAEAIGRAALARAALVIGDDIAVGVAASTEPEVRRFAGMVRGQSRLAEATLFAATSGQADRFWVAAANAMAITTAEFDEGSRHTPCHAGLYTVPALIAEAEPAGLACRDLLRAEVLAYELTVRIAEAWTSPAGAYPSLYTHARAGTIGAAIARGIAAGLDADALVAAIGVAATLTAAGPRNHLLGGAMVRNVWPAAAAWNGMMAVEWSLGGSAALPTALDDVFAGVFGFTARPEVLRRPLGGDWQIEDGYHRLHACHLFFSALIEALVEARGMMVAGGTLPAVSAIEVAIHDDALRLVDPRPATTLAARFSIPHVAAATLVTGAAGMPAFSAAALADPAIDALRAKVRVVPIDRARFPAAKWPAAVTVEAGGRTWRAERAEATGGHGRPHPVSAVLAKIDGLTADAWPGFGPLVRRLAALDPEVLDWPVARLLATARARA